MRDSSTMQALFATGLGAGFVSALLFASIATRSLFAIVLFFVAPLPILLAAIGWNHRAGLVAALSGAAFVGLVFGPLSGITYALSIALPAWWAGYLLLLARHDAQSTEWYPLGQLLVWIAGISAALTLLGAMLLGDGDYGAFVREFERTARRLLELQPSLFDGLVPGQQDDEAADVGRLIAGAAPPISAAVSVISSVALLWAAARIVRASGRLPRPWAGIHQLRIPLPWLGVLALAALLGFLISGFPGLGLRSLTASLLMAYCLQGLTVIHALTLGVSGRGGILTGVWVTFFLMPGWPVLLYAAVGIIDSVLDLRARKAGAGPPAPTSS
jgi:hypothetical protein